MATLVHDETTTNLKNMFQQQNHSEKSTFRDFTSKTKKFSLVYNLYVKMHTEQCVKYVQQKHEQWLQFDHGEYTIMEILDKLSGFEDESDPDVDFPNLYHGYQTGEGLRKQYPDKDWLHLCGLLHDIGKIMAIWGEPQHSTVGDTFVVGAEFGSSVVYRDTTFANNLDLNDPRYNTKYGIYEPNCGLDNLLMSWGHDEYLYQVLKQNKCTIPDEGLYCIRYHSFYPWHTGGDYEHLCSDRDRSMKPWILKFNEHDLYTKAHDLPNIEELKPYYQQLVEKYAPGKLKW